MKRQDKKQQPSDVRRHGFGSPEGMEMTGVVPTEDIGTTLQRQQQPQLSQQQSPPSILAVVSMSPPPSIGPTSTDDSTPPSATGTNVHQAAEIGDPQISTPSQQGDSPSKPSKRRLFFTPSPRRSTEEGEADSSQQQQQQQQQGTSISTQPEVAGVASRPTPTTSTIPPSSFTTPAQTRTSGRRRPMTTPGQSGGGLSGLSTTPRSSRQQQQTASGRRSFNPLNRISDIFSPQSPSFSRASPGLTPVQAADSSSDDISSASSGSSTSSVKEPFTEQVERLKALLATPAEQLGDLAQTTDFGRDQEDDDLDSEMDDLETSQRLLAQELSRADYSMLGFTPGSSSSPSTPGSSAVKGEGEKGKKKRRRKKTPKVQDESGDDWVPLISTEGGFEPNFSPMESEKQSSSQKGTGSSGKSSSAGTPSSAAGKYYSPLKSPPRGKAASPQESPPLNVAQDKKPSPTYHTPPTFSPDNVEQEEDSKPAALKSPPSAVVSGDAQKQYTPERQELPGASPASPFNFFGLGSPSSSETSASLNPVEGFAGAGTSPTEARPSTESITPGTDTQVSSLGMDGASQEASRTSSADDGNPQGATRPFAAAGGTQNMFQSIATFADRLVDNGSSSGHDRESEGTIRHVVDETANSSRLLEELDTILTPPRVEDRQRLPTVTPDDRLRGRESIDGSPKSTGQPIPNSFDGIASAQADRILSETQATKFPTPRGRAFGLGPFTTPPQDRRQLPSLVDATASAQVERAREEPQTRAEEVQASAELQQTPQRPTQGALQTIVPASSDVVLRASSQALTTPMRQPSDEILQDTVEPELVGTQDPQHGKVAGLSENDPSTELPSTEADVTDTASGKEKTVEKQMIKPIPPPPDRSKRPPRIPASASSSFAKEIDSAQTTIQGTSQERQEEAQEGDKLKTQSIGLGAAAAGTIPLRRLASQPSDELQMDSSRTSTHEVQADAKVQPMPAPPTIANVIPDESDDELVFDTETPRAESEGEYKTPEQGDAIQFFDPSKMPLSYDTAETPGTVPVKSYDTSETPGSPMEKDKKEDDQTRRCRGICVSIAFIVLIIGVAIVVGNIIRATSDETEEPIPAPSFRPIPPSESPPSQATDAPTPFGTISFVVPYQIYIQNGNIIPVPEPHYVPSLIQSMDMLTYDILLNLGKRRNKENRRKLTAVLLPTKTNQIKNITCPGGPETYLCQEIEAQISLVDAENTWESFKATTELAIEIGRLQYHLDEVDPDCPAAIIDSLLIWTLPRPTPSPSRPPTLIPSPLPSATVTTSSPVAPSQAPTAFSLFDLLTQNSFDGGDALQDTSSPQHMAYQWLSKDDNLEDYSSARILQRYAMATFYYSTNGDDWLFNDLWLSNQTECDWYNEAGSRGACNKDEELVNLELDINNLSGSLPPELGLLSSALQRMTLQGGPVTFLSGTIPSELGYLSTLKIFFLRGNNIYGTIPPEIGSWSSLEEFDVSRNRLSGQLPPEIGNFQELTFFEVSANSLSGFLPTTLGQLVKCTQLYFEDNIFYSSLPTELGNLGSLEVIKGGSNILLSLPSELGLLSSADTISFHRSNIPGSIPTEFGQLEQLRILELKDNVLSGRIPSEVGRLTGLRDQLDLSRNRLEGEIPSELGLLTELRGLKLQDNMLSGQVPTALSELSKLTSIRIDGNDLSGTIPLNVCATFNITYPAFTSDCNDFEDRCPCCTTCCIDGRNCQCRYIDTPQEFLCFQQKGALP